MEFAESVTIDDVVYTDIVPRKYRLNPETDDLLYADYLQNGMRVLFGQTEFLYNEAFPQLYNFGLPKVNRWCKVTEIRQEDDVVYFIGVYDDGNKIIRHAHKTVAWLVKKDSLRQVAASSPFKLNFNSLK